MDSGTKRVCNVDKPRELLYMIGGMGYEPIKEIVEAQIYSDSVSWAHTEFKS